ncbi:peptide chain release factor 1-like: mitochondrial [Dinothrombium tinctorium]|uniref:Peptide chain release factor 1-like: mitochondrial n=1 Tax=Dinothrombium tinctorium TaxID=1965070 RepID=A0A443RCC0_9ACAR|nr:peptide chain release factor 1-like: mitochondrial [Dinothrombium tinctorium]RWS12964.1 peptide chain release factor 1-like: mitochondrial [Dinothrombium tinctorium]
MLGLSFARRCFSSLHVKSLLSTANRQSLRKVIQEKAEKKTLYAIDKLSDEIKELNEMKTSAEKALHNMIEEEIASISEKIESIENELIEQIVCEDDSDVNDVIVELSCGIGGQEAMLFTGEMFNVYHSYFCYRNWSFNIIEKQETEIGGIRNATIEVNGPSCYQLLRHEAGIHRVQRVPETESGGRIHTSTITVAVLPIREKELNLTIDKKDLKIETMRSSGAGGQHVNKTESCVRITHIPTGTVVECQEERSQITNRARAMKKLEKILIHKKSRERFQDEESLRKSQILNAARSDKIRTYNFNQDRITDHRINHNMYDVKSFMTSNPDKLHQLLTLLEENYRKNFLRMLVESK